MLSHTRYLFFKLLICLIFTIAVILLFRKEGPTIINVLFAVSAIVYHSVSTYVIFNRLKKAHAQAKLLND